MTIIASIASMVILGGLFVTLGLRRRAQSLDDYITHRGKSSLNLTAFSLAASVLGGWILFSPVETGTWAGVSGLIGYALGQATPLFVLALAGPLLIKKLPEGYGFNHFIQQRYGEKTAFLTGILILFYMGTFLTAELLAIGQVLSFIFKIPLLISCSLIMLLIFTYVFKGGLGTSIYTDRIQLYVLIPLLIAFAAAVVLKQSDTEPIFTQIVNNSPQLLSLDFIPGIEFGIVLFIGVTASNIFHQGFWQRIYAIKKNESQSRAFVLGGIIVIPIILIAGFLGVIAKASGALVPEEPALGIFHLLDQLSPIFTVILVVIAFVLVLSSIDTLLNGMVSTIVSWRRVKEKTSSNLKLPQILTIGIGLVAVLAASRGGSVLYLFLLADLLCSALAFPLIFGLFNRYITGSKAIIAGLFGLTVGALFFPLPDFSSWSGLPANMLISFLSALGISTILSLGFALWDKKAIKPTQEVT